MLSPYCTPPLVIWLTWRLFSLSESELDKDYESFLGSIADKDSEVQKFAGEDWRDVAFATAKEQLASDAFVEPDKVWTLVGHGERTNDNCGTFMRRKTKKFMACGRVHKHNEVGVTLEGVDCRDKVFVQRVFYSCNSPECPSCFLAWDARESVRAEARLRYIQDRFGVRFEHIIVSPPQDWKGTFEDLKKYVLRVMLRRGVDGGVLIYHHFRYHDKDETFVGERAHYLVGGHFHVLGTISGGYGNCRNCRCLNDGTFDECHSCNGFESVTRRAYVDDGCIVKVKDARKSLGGSLYYELSHASIRRDVKKHVVLNWFGRWGRNKLVIPKGSLPQKQYLCKICCEPLYEMRYKGDYAELLAYMSGFKDSQGFVLDYRDRDGTLLWEAVHDKG